MDEDGSYSGQTYKEKKLRAFREEVKEDLKRESTPHYELWRATSRFLILPHTLYYTTGIEYLSAQHVQLITWEVEGKRAIL